MSIVCRKKVKGGILLYALFMAAVFSLLLQFYLRRQVGSQQIFQFSRERTTAYAMAVLAAEQANRDGTVRLDKGEAAVRSKGSLLEVSSQLDSGRSYRFFFAADGDKKAGQQKESSAKDDKAGTDWPADEKNEENQNSDRGNAADST